MEVANRAPNGLHIRCRCRFAACKQSPVSQAEISSARKARGRAVQCAGDLGKVTILALKGDALMY
jgi:hypothetical protein